MKNNEEEELLLSDYDRAVSVYEEEKSYKNSKRLLKIKAFLHQYRHYLTILMLIITLIITLYLFFFQSINGKNEEINTNHEQVHISLAKDPRTMVISWTTFFDMSKMNNNPTVKYGLNSSNLALTETGSTKIFKHITGNITRYFHRVYLTDLLFDTTYYYKVGDDQTWSKIFYFHTFPEGTNYDVKFCIFGDMDTGKNSTIIALSKAVKTRECEIILHIGDIAYQLQKNDGLVGDDFMRQIESIAAYAPYMVIDGNHEFDCYGFSHYEERFVMPLEDNEVPGMDHFYSFNVGPVSLVALSSEVYGFYAVYGPDPIKRQAKWLDNELQKIEHDKENHPWTISYLHRPLYCYMKYHEDECNEYENTMILRGYKDIPGLEEYFHTYNVDLVLYGHEHIYQRNYPVYNRTVYQYKNDIYYNPPATTYVLSGAGGCVSCTVEKEINKSDGFPFGAQASLEIGYTLVHVLNYTHINVTQIGTVNNTRIDSFMIVKDIGFTMDKRTNDTPIGIYRPFELSEPNYPYLKPTNYLLWCLDNSNMTLYDNTSYTNHRFFNDSLSSVGSNISSSISLMILFILGVINICILTNT
uniref:Purple acid phosphatase n=1 Tax=Strongyloides papillosus TaxID=174720 RepID=A0A0N5BAV9_STREA